MHFIGVQIMQFSIYVNAGGEQEMLYIFICPDATPTYFVYGSSSPFMAIT